jgi:hypothetical protein
VRFLIFLLLAIASVTCWAHSPEDVDPAMAPWFQSLQVPANGKSCCNERDCATVSVANLKIENGTYWVRDPSPDSAIWLIVPPGNILNRYDNPTGKPVACIWGHTVICFVVAAGI